MVSTQFWRDILQLRTDNNNENKGKNNTGKMQYGKNKQLFRIQKHTNVFKK